MQFDKVQNQIVSKRNKAYALPSILYTQLLGLRLGIGKEELGIDSPDNKDNEHLNQIYSKLFDTEDKKEKKPKKKKPEKKELVKEKAIKKEPQSVE